ncbi:DUF305 domain-containing protein [Arthrobacter sp. JZ12]|uniref:DUF305 domain-containing protein n=1 Tax=Arthrobacter sp. JZ12 TaxID=2654190 RepID=UPI002B49157F|nr:DUF305 domain-containing protein [Arthrobacter sp. JZ12]WRH26394.1 DUF305 domain-containing protein [Arthrobacter sp. JZ12]
MKRYLALPAFAAAAVVVLAGCGATGDAAGSTAETGSTADSTAEAGAHNDADVMFAQMMIPHHEQAVEMSDVVLGKDGVSAEVADLATRIKEAQAPEIGTLNGWLEAWGESAEGHAGHSAESMDGMLSGEQMAELEAADGDAAGELFLESMIAHHEGAVAMAEEEIANGENTEAVALAETIVETQEAEITEMKELLGE